MTRQNRSIRCLRSNSFGRVVVVSIDFRHNAALTSLPNANDVMVNRYSLEQRKSGSRTDETIKFGSGIVRIESLGAT